MTRLMAIAARAFIESLEPEQKSRVTGAFDAADRREFTYLPGRSRLTPKP